MPTGLRRQSKKRLALQREVEKLFKISWLLRWPPPNGNWEVNHSVWREWMRKVWFFYSRLSRFWPCEWFFLSWKTRNSFFDWKSVPWGSGKIAQCGYQVEKHVLCKCFGWNPGTMGCGLRLREDDWFIYLFLTEGANPVYTSPKSIRGYIFKRHILPFQSFFTFSLHPQQVISSPVFSGPDFHRNYAIQNPCSLCPCGYRSSLPGNPQRMWNCWAYRGTIQHLIEDGREGSCRSC